MNKDPFLPTNVSGNFIKLRNKLISATGKAIADFNMIEDKDVVMVSPFFVIWAWVWAIAFWGLILV